MRKSRDQIYNELLVIKSQQGDRQAFNELVERWQKRLWNYAYRVTGSESAAWDIVQESWHGMIKGIKKLDDAAVFGRWAFRIVNNKCVDWLRRQRQQYKLDDELIKNSRDESDEKQNSNDKSEILLDAVGKLSPERRTLLMLRYQQGFDIEQIAQIINVPAGTVKSRLHRTLDQLKEIIERLKNE
jgi:RNA polymerase sigma factor (sigma-70 family)